METQLTSPSSAFWKAKKVFLTGHTGFKGSWLSLWLKKLGADVTGFALPAPHQSLFQQAAIYEHVHSCDGDIRDASTLYEVMHTANPDIIFHLAAQPLVRRSYHDPVETFSVNTLGTVQVLECMRQLPNIQAAVIITTDKCYQDRQWPWPYRENDQLGGHDPYSASKACAELATAAYSSSYFSSGGPVVVTARAGNVIGGGDWAEDRLIPDFIRAFSKGDPVHIRRPDAVRPWQHVLEPLAGYLLLAEACCRPPLTQGSWNFGPDETQMKSVGWMTEAFVHHWGNNATWTHAPGPHPHETTLLRLDSSKARQILHWQPRLNINQTLAWTVDWYKRQMHGGDAYTLCSENLDAYCAMDKGN